MRRNYKKNIYYKTDEEIELIRESCLLVCKVHEHIASTLKPGVTGAELDKQAEELIRDHKAEPAFKGLYGFPSTLCISLNEQVVHGIPSDKPFEEGDIVSFDCGTYLNDFYGDAAYTFAIGEIPEDTMKLLVTTKESLYLAIDNARVGKRLGDIGFAVQNLCERQNKYGVVRDLVGHGIGKALHEEPQVPNHGRRGNGIKLQDGLVIAIEPMVNMGTKDVRELKDGWTIISKDKTPSAHYEHTVAVRKSGPDILSDHKIIEEAIKKNANLQEISLKN